MTDVATAQSWITTLGGLTAVAALIGAIWTIRRGVKGDSREALAQEASRRRDTIADRDSMLNRLEGQLARLEARLDKVEGELEQERLWSQMLVDHIAHRRGWPPPPRPTT